MDPAKLKVVELRERLQARGLDTKGVKAVLVERLRAALEEETGEEQANTTILDTSTEENDASMEETAAPAEQEPERAESPMRPTVSPSPSPEEVSLDQPEPSPLVEPTPEPSPVVSPGPGITQDQDDSVPEPVVELPGVEVKNEKEEEPKEKSFDIASYPEYKPASIKTEVKQEDESNEKVGETIEEAKGDSEVKLEGDVKVEQPEVIELKDEDEKMDASGDGRSDHRERHRERDDRKRRRSPSPRRRSPVRKAEDEPELDEAAEVLSWYDSDLNLVIDKAGFLSAAPMHINGFGYIWAGARATFGFGDGKLAFQTKVEEDLDVSHLEKESCPNVLRVGWSVLSASMQLGEEPLSYGFGGTGKASTDCKFKDYGVPFKVGDIVTSYLEWTEEDAVLSFAVNGETHGEAYRVPREKLGGQPLFPHVLSKNQRFSVDFGAREEPWFPLDEGFVFVGAAPVEGRVAGPRRPEKKEDCEMVMMCGLPGAGKTTWVNKYVVELPEKKFNVLGTNALIDKMRVDGLPRKGNYEGRWEQLIEKCTRCLLKLMEVAAGRRRNYILDQTNVYPSAQRRKMRGFEGFVRRAIVIVPTDEEFKSRVAKREALEGKDVPDAAVLEMKANFALPDEGDVFSAVTFVELDRKESQVLVEQYNKEGRAAGFGGQSKRPRHDSRDRSSGSHSRGHRTRGGPDNRNQRSGGGGWQPRGGGGGGWRDRNDGFRRGGAGDRGGWRGNPRGGSRGNDSRSGGGGGYDRNRSNSNNRNQNSGGGNKGNWSQGYNQGGGGNWGNGGGWGQGYNQQQQGGGNWGQQGWKNYNQQGSGYNQQGGYGQQGGYNQQSGYGQQTGYGNGNYGNWNTQQQQAYYQQAYGAQGWGQANADGTYNYNSTAATTGTTASGAVGTSGQQGTWQGYSQGYNYGSQTMPAATTQGTASAYTPTKQ